MVQHQPPCKRTLHAGRAEEVEEAAAFAGLFQNGIATPCPILRRDRANHLLYELLLIGVQLIETKAWPVAGWEVLDKAFLVGELLDGDLLLLLGEAFEEFDRGLSGGLVRRSALFGTGEDRNSR